MKYIITLLLLFRISIAQDIAELEKNIDPSDILLEIYKKDKNKQSYLEEILMYQQAADSGDAYAQTLIGIMYDDGMIIERDSEEALKWLTLASNQGNYYAQFHIGRVMRYSMDNHIEAIKWYQLAAEQGYDEAQYYLGEMYKKGNPYKRKNRVDQNYDHAIKWLTLAANQGHNDAQIALGDIYEQSEGIQQDYDEAFKWYKLAAETSNSSYDYTKLADMYFEGKGTNRDYSKAKEIYGKICYESKKQNKKVCTKYNKSILIEMISLYSPISLKIAEYL